MTLFLPLPLRSTTALPKYTSVQVLPHRYGRTTGPLIPYDSTGLLWLWADHSIGGVDSTTGLGEWKWFNTTDPSGHAVGLVEFGQPQDITLPIQATGRGKIDPVLGTLIENPADAVLDILVNIAGLSYTTGQLSEFRAECARRNLLIAGSIEVADSAQTVIRSLCGSVGAVFCAHAQRLCRVWPGGDARAVRATVAPPTDAILKAAIVLTDLVNDVTVQFAPISGTPQKTIRITEPESIKAYGLRQSTLAAPWIGSEQVAIDMAARFLVQNARPNWVVEVSNIRTDVSVTDDVALAHPLVPTVSAAMVQTHLYDFATGRTIFTVGIPVGSPPVIDTHPKASGVA